METRNDKENSEEGQNQNPLPTSLFSTMVRQFWLSNLFLGSAPLPTGLFSTLVEVALVIPQVGTRCQRACSVPRRVNFLNHFLSKAHVPVPFYRYQPDLAVFNLNGWGSSFDNLFERTGWYWVKRIESPFMVHFHEKCTMHKDVIFLFGTIFWKFYSAHKTSRFIRHLFSLCHTFYSS